MDDILADVQAGLRAGREYSKKSTMNELRPHERATLELRLNDLLKFLNAPGDWGYDTPLADLTIYLLKFREMLNRP